MSEKLAPTRGNLVKLTGSMKMLRSGHNLLEQKRQVLMMELVRYIDSAKTLQAQIAEAFSNAYAALERASLSEGIELIDDIAQAIAPTENITVRFHSVMGVEVPDIDALDTNITPAYSFRSSSGALDEAYLAFRQLLTMLVNLAEVETSVCRLALQVRSTHRRVNALEKFVIPNQLSQIHFISDTLEEGDREDFTRMKMAQKKKSA